MRILQGEGHSARGGILDGEEFWTGRNSARGGILQGEEFCRLGGEAFWGQGCRLHIAQIIGGERSSRLAAGHSVACRSVSSDSS